MLNNAEHSVLRNIFRATIVLYILTALMPFVSFLFTNAGAGQDPDRMKVILQKYGTYGDSFGVINTAFSGFGLLGAFYIIFLQRRELEQQRTIADKADLDREYARLKDSLDRMLTFKYYLAQYYQQLYVSNTTLYDTEYVETERDHPNFIGITVKGKMENYKKFLEQHLEIMVANETINFIDFKP